MLIKMGAGAGEFLTQNFIFDINLIKNLKAIKNSLII